MWDLLKPFRRVAPPAEVDDPMLGRIKGGVLAAIAALANQVATLEHKLALIDENATESRKIEGRVTRAETQVVACRALLEDQVSRIDAALVQIRGTMTGGLRGRPRGARSSDAEQLGEALLERIGPEGAQQLMLELEQREGGVGPVG